MGKKKISDFYISSICEDCIKLSKQYGFGIESTEYSYAENMDRYYEQTHPKILEYKNATDNLFFHAPFYELTMAAIDSKAKEISEFRYNQFIDITESYGAKKLVFHSGYNPNVYYVEWFEPNCIDFLKKLLSKRKCNICLENVFSKTPEMIYNIISNVNLPNLKICIDIGHINAYSNRINGLDGNDLVYYWVDKLAPMISHFHIHNNDGKVDTHNDIFNGTLDIKKILEFTNEKCPDATYTIEVSKINDFAKEIYEMFK